MKIQGFLSPYLLVFFVFWKLLYVIHLTTLQGSHIHQNKKSLDPIGREIGILESKEEIIKNYETRKATVTAYNTVPQQADNSPCISSDGTNICGRSDVVACPSDIPFGTRVAIDGRDYYCHDRTASKYNGRFDISFDKDIRGAIEFGKRELEVIIIK